MLKINTMMLIFFLCFFIQIFFGSMEAKDVHCVFIHGAGMRPRDEYVSLEIEDLAVVDVAKGETVYRDIFNLPPDLKSYWGDVKAWAEMDFSESDGSAPCTSYAFTYLNTVDTTWYDELSAASACQSLEPDNKFSADYDTRVFLHSMGNLIFFNALAKEKCQIDPSHTKVYSFGGPFLGTEMVKLAENVCSNHDTWQSIVQSKIGKSIRHQMGKKFENYEYWRKIVTDAWYSRPAQVTFSTICDVKNGGLVPAFKSIGELYPNGDEEMLKMAKKYTTGAICGSEFGEETLLNKFLTKFTTKVYNHAEHDGAVPLDSCKAVNPDASWNTNAESKFWIAKYHHNAIIGRESDVDITDWLARRE